MSDRSGAADVDLGTETAKATVAKFSMAGIGFVGTVIFANILGPAKFGSYYLLFALVKVADLPIDGWSNAAKKRFSEADASPSQASGGQFLFASSWITIITAIVFLGSNHLRAFTKVDNAGLLFAGLLIGEGLYLSCERLLQAQGRVSIATWTDALRSYLTFGIQLVLVLSGWGVAGMAVGLSVASVIVVPVSLYFLQIVPSIPSRETLSSQWEYAKYSVIGALFGRIYDRFDILILGHLLGPTAAGWYEVALKLVTPTKFIAETASSGLMARVSSLASRNAPVKDDVQNVLSFASVLAIPAFLGALAISHPLIITIYGPEYEGAVPLLVVIALYHLIMTQNMPISQSILGLDRPSRISVISGIALAINIVAGVLLTLRYGPVGVAVSTLFAEVFMLGCYLWTVRDLGLDINLGTRPLLEQFGAGIVMYATVTIWATKVSIDSWLTLGTTLVLAGCIYFGVLFTVSEAMRVTARSILR